MDWVEEVKQKLKRKNQILFSKNCEFLSDLNTLLCSQNRKTVILWSLDFAAETAAGLLLKEPTNGIAQRAVDAAELWAQGTIKMPVAKSAILECHAFAKELPPEDAALHHAVAQGCSTVHACGHAIGYSVYELTALVMRYGIEDCAQAIEARKNEYIERLFYWQNNYKTAFTEWAAFIKD